MNITMPLEDFATPTDWIQDLDVRWPERIPMKASLIETAAEHLGQLHHRPRVLELGIGDGELLEWLTTRYPHAEFVAVDVNQTLLTFVGEKLKSGLDCAFIRQDLRDVEWAPAIGADFDVIFSMQSFHDLGGRESLTAVYRQCLARLKRSGLLLNADFVEPMPQDDPAQPRRFPGHEHVAVLQDLAAVDAQFLYRHGTLGCIAASTGTP